MSEIFCYLESFLLFKEKTFITIISSMFLSDSYELLTYSIFLRCFRNNIVLVGLYISLRQKKKREIVVKL